MTRPNTLISRIKPVNRHLLVVPHLQQEDNKTETGVLLPESFQQENEETYIEATVVDVAEDCSSQFRHLKYENINHNNKVIIDKTMLETISLKDRKFHLILENYVVGVYREDL